MAAPMAALATANRLSGRSGKSLKPSYAVTTWLVSYWLSTCWGIVYSMKGIGMWLPGENSGQEARSERMTSGGVAERRELQLVRCRCRRVVGEPRLLLVEHEGTLG